MTFQFCLAGIIFIATFALIASEKIHKTSAALIGSALMLLFILPGPSHDSSGANDTSASVEKYTIAQEIMPPNLQTEQSGAGGEKNIEILDTYSRYVNFDVVFTLAGMMILVNILGGTGLFQYIAIKAAKFAGGEPLKTMILLVVATAVLSAFLDNVTTILLVAPITFVVASELSVSPLPFLMSETLASNIGGAATLIGDPPNLIIGSAANLDFMSFIINLAPFIMVLLILYCIGLWIYYNKRMSVTVEKRARILELDEMKAITDSINLRRAGIVVLLTLIGFLIHGFIGVQPCVIAMSGAALALVVCKVDVDEMLGKIEWGTLFFFLGLFILVEGAAHVGIMAEIGKLLTFTAAWNPLLIILSVMWFCGLAVAIMNNVSFTTVIITVIGAFLQTSPAFHGNLQLQRLMWWGIALAVCLGGNFTIIGAAANLVTAGISEQAGYKITFNEFFKYGAPIALVSLIMSSAYIMFRYFILVK
jgi:Na+/H+ antiporter NhaD/arsenite permease-like protein